MGTANSIAGGGDMDAHVEAEAETVDEIMSAAAAMGLRRRVVSVAAAPGGGDVVVKSPVPMHLYPFAPASALEVSTDSIEQQPQLPQEQGQQPPQQQDKRDSVVGGQTALKVGGQEEDASSQNDSQAQPPSTLPFTIPQLDPISIILIGAPGQQGQEQQLQQHQEQGQGQELQEHLLPWSEPPLYYPPAIAAIIAASANDDSNSNNLSPSLYFDNHDPNRTLGYNLVALLFTLFFGVLILTEFVLDREDEDLVHIQSLYWSRVVGIASATIVSAVHGSLLSGYVLLEEHTDWIAKLAVGVIVAYWWGMVWIMNWMTGLY